MATRRVKFSSRADSTLLETLRGVARKDERYFQALLEDAMLAYFQARMMTDPGLLGTFFEVAKRHEDHFLTSLEDVISRYAQAPSGTDHAPLPQAQLADMMRVYLQTHAEEDPRPSVMAHFEASLERHHRLGELLAK